jgi:hypothetical protein
MKCDPVKVKFGCYIIFILLETYWAFHAKTDKKINCNLQVGDFLRRGVVGDFVDLLLHWKISTRNIENLFDIHFKFPISQKNPLVNR